MISPHGDGGSHGKPHRHPLAVRSYLLGTLIALPAVWYLTEAAYAAPGLVA